MPRIVRVEQKYLNSTHVDNDTDVLERHGYLWFVEGGERYQPRRGDILCTCRSLATGFEHCWYESEMVEATDA